MNKRTLHNHHLPTPSRSAYILSNAVRVGIEVSRMAGFNSVSKA